MLTAEPVGHRVLQIANARLYLWHQVGPSLPSLPLISAFAAQAYPGATKFHDIQLNGLSGTPLFIDIVYR